MRGDLLCSCWLFAPHFSAIDGLQECSSLFEELKGSTAFAGYMAGRLEGAGYLCEFHTEQ